VDVEMSESNPFPFIPMKDGSAWDPVKGTSYITRLSADMNGRNVSGYEIERLYDYTGGLPRQDDRYNTEAYRYGFLGTRDIRVAERAPLRIHWCAASPGRPLQRRAQPLRPPRQPRHQRGRPSLGQCRLRAHGSCHAPDHVLERRCWNLAG